MEGGAVALRHLQKTDFLEPVSGSMVVVAGHFPPEVQRQLKIMAAEERSRVQALLGEALDLLFAKRRKPQIATKTREESQR
jgi:hypothetical protein